jgi:non-ribosomal peptide synthetase component F
MLQLTEGSASLLVLPPAVLFVFQSAETTSPYHLRFSLKLVFDKKMALLIEYDRSVFLATTALRMLQHLVQIIESVSVQDVQEVAAGVNLAHVLGQAQLPVSKLHLHPSSVIMNDVPQTESTLADAPGFRVTDLVESQAAAIPDAPALMWLWSLQAASIPAPATMSYRELNYRSTKASVYLQQCCGLQEGAVVATMLTEGPAMVLLQLAVHRCGATFVPIESKVH